MKIKLGGTTIIYTPHSFRWSWKWLSVPGPRKQTFWNLTIPIGNLAIMRSKPFA